MIGRKIDVERLVVWALAEEGVGPDAGSFLSSSGSSAASVEAYLARGGVRIQGGGGGREGMADPDALEVWSAISSLDPDSRSLVLRHGRLGTRPDYWPDVAPRLVPRLDADGRPALSRAWSASRKRIPQYCELVLEATAGEINRHRRLWDFWHSGLVTLREILKSARLRLWEPTGPMVPARPCEPWNYSEIVPFCDPAAPDPALLHPMHRAPDAGDRYEIRPYRG